MGLAIQLRLTGNILPPSSKSESKSSKVFMTKPDYNLDHHMIHLRIYFVHNKSVQSFR